MHLIFFIKQIIVFGYRTETPPFNIRWLPGRRQKITGYELEIFIKTALIWNGFAHNPGHITGTVFDIGDASGNRMQDGCWKIFRQLNGSVAASAIRVAGSNTIGLPRSEERRVANERNDRRQEER